MSRTTRTIGIIGVVFFVLGLVGWILQLSGGLLANSGMTNIFLWGIMIAMFAFMVGFGAGCQLIGSALYLFGGSMGISDGERRTYARMACTISLACVGAAGIAILADLGNISSILFMMSGFNPASPLSWDMVAITCFIIASVIQLIMIARGSESIKVWAAIAGIFAIIMQIVEGLLFATQTAHAWWASPIIPVDFLVVAFVSGSALMLLIACIKKADDKTVFWIGRFCAWAIAVHLILTLADLVLIAMKGSAVSDGVLAAIVGVMPLYLCELLLPAIAMVLLFANGRKCKSEGNSHALCKAGIVASVLTIVGIFAHRLMLLYPSYNAPSLYLQLSGTDLTTGPYAISTGRYLDWDTSFALTTSYLPSGGEWLAAFLPIGFAIIAFFILVWIMNKIGKASEA